MGHQFRDFLVLISSTARAISSPSRQGTTSPKISFSRSNTPYLPCLTPSSTRSSCKALHSPSSWAFLPAPPRGGSWRKEAPPDRSLTFPGLPTSQLLRDQHGRTGLSWCEPTTTSATHPLCFPTAPSVPNTPWVRAACFTCHTAVLGHGRYGLVSRGRAQAGRSGLAEGVAVNGFAAVAPCWGAEQDPHSSRKGPLSLVQNKGAGWHHENVPTTAEQPWLLLWLVPNPLQTAERPWLPHSPTLPRHSSLCVQVLPGRGGAEVAACPPWPRWSGLICCQGGWYHNCPSCSVGPRVTSSPEPALSVTALPPSLTATVFLELWKRKRATVVTSWDLYEWDEEEVRTFQLPTSLFRAGVSCTYRKDTSQAPPCPA